MKRTYLMRSTVTVTVEHVVRAGGPNEGGLGFAYKRAETLGARLALQLGGAVLDHAEALGVELASCVPTAVRATHMATNARQIDGPWVGLLDFDARAPHVLVAQRAAGWSLTERDVELLTVRMAELGFDVTDRWNGAGCDSVSFRVANPHRLSGEERAHLTATRPPDPYAACTAGRRWAQMCLDLFARQPGAQMLARSARRRCVEPAPHCAGRAA